MNTFINLAVADLARSRAFFEALGFGFDERFCDDTALGMVISETSFAMLLTADKFAGFTPRTLADATKVSEVLVALQLESREAVDAMMATAMAHGATTVRPPEDHGFMYGHAFADPDGHIWEPFWMNVDALTDLQEDPR
ncbi:VOC family protein [Tropicimonas sp. IMCC34043]|uniref:VOC family protein n=1 Tax=Tropicimonas sp. IMCC34043 TaxID=2248760 RepID=UPI000E22EEC1|nr:VOC family protein [Tropicimonas sp. IMCC34043]